MNNSITQSSPLDPFLAQFLSIIEANDRRFVPGPESKDIAAQMDVPRAFIDALFTSARTRGLLKPAYGRGNKVHWKISTSGSEFVLRLGKQPALA